MWLSTIAPIVLALATLDDATKIEMILSVSHHSRWPRQVQYWLLRAAGADIFAVFTNKLLKSFIALDLAWTVKKYATKLFKVDDEKSFIKILPERRCSSGILRQQNK
jgi:hypothetical protein